MTDEPAPLVASHAKLRAGNEPVRSQSYAVCGTAPPTAEAPVVAAVAASPVRPASANVATLPAPAPARIPAASKASACGLVLGNIRSFSISDRRDCAAIHASPYTNCTRETLANPRTAVNSRANTEHSAATLSAAAVAAAAAASATATSAPMAAAAAG